MDSSEPLTTTKHSALAHPALGGERIGSLAELPYLRIGLQSELRSRVRAKCRLMQAGGDQWITQ